MIDKNKYLAKYQHLSSNKWVISPIHMSASESTITMMLCGPRTRDRDISLYSYEFAEESGA